MVDKLLEVRSVVLASILHLEMFLHLHLTTRRHRQKCSLRVPHIEERTGSQNRHSIEGILVVSQYKRLSVTNAAPVGYDIRAYSVRD